MDFYKVFSFLTILKESIKLLPKNGKLMAIIAILSLLLSLISYASVYFLMQDMLDTQKSFMPDPSSFNASDPTSFTPSLTPSQFNDQFKRVQEMTMLLYAVEIAFILVFFIISLFTTIATILVSAMSYTGNTLSIKVLFSRISRTWKRPLITSISVSIHALGYFLAVGSLVVPVFLYPNIITSLLAIFVGIAAFVYYLYLLVIWTLAIVVSVIEESCYGMVAMGKASTLVKRQRLNGFMLNLFFSLLSLITVLVNGLVMIFGKQGLSSSIFYVLVFVIFSCLVKILQVVAYTVLYFHCKKNHGEDTEMDGIIKYDLLPTTQPRY